MRGYPLDEIMGRLTFGESIYLLLMGDVPSPAIGSLMEAILVSFIDHGVDAPVDAGGAEHRNHRRAAARMRRGGRARVRPLPRRRHRELHAVSRLRARAGAQGGVRTRTRRRRSSQRCRRAGEPIPASATASTRAIRAPRGCSRWRWSSRSKATTSR